MTAPRFLPLPREARVVGWIRRVLIGVACVHVAVSCWSFTRRVWQILRIELTVSSPVLSPGVTVSTDVIASGETHNVIRLELVQGRQVETLLEQRSRVSSVSAYDLRVFRYTPSVVITPELVRRFEPGPATLRLTGFGAQKLLRTPAARVRELAVTIPAR